jgi:GT2 family glycosyltransferase
LESLAAQTDEGMDIILVDDGSTDGTAEAVRERFPQAQILSGDGSLWWTGAVNLGIRQVLSSAGPDDYVVLVNNDTSFKDDFIARCRATAKRLPECLVGSIVVDSSQETIIAGGTQINWYTAKQKNLNFGKRLDEFPPGHLEVVSVLTGRGVMVPCKVYRKIGLYDDRHFQQCGDTELPRRANLKNFPIYVCYDLVTYNTDPEYVSLKRRFKTKKIWDYFFDTRSQTRLKYRYWFAINTAANPLQCTCFLLCDLTRVIVNFLRSARSKELVAREEP